ncbi:MAG: hypothetical protein RLZZ124_1100 [Cyanobacteriota bacterium]|jgi:hypothetical protein
MPSLPFVVAPKRETRIISATVNGEDCSIEFPVFGSILAGEAIAIREHEYQAVVYRETSRLADALVAEGMEETEAQRRAIRVLSTRMGITLPLGPGEQRIMLRHADLVARIQSALAAEFELQKLRTVTAAIANRLPGCREWTDDDSITLPGPVRDAILAFIDAERNANRPQKTQEELEEEMVETLGKLDPDSRQLPSTGPDSTGDAASSGQLLLSSTPSDSPDSPSPTSSKRSKKVSVG